VGRLISDGIVEDDARRMAKAPFEGLPDHAHIDVISICTQVIISLILIQRFQFSRGIVFDFETTGSLDAFERVGVGNYDIDQSSLVAAGALPLRSSPVYAVELQSLVRKLDCYYNSYQWKMDRMAIALNRFWAAMCSTDQGDRFVNFTIILEALLNTGDLEITHQLAERAAVLLSGDANDRYQLYHQVRRCYGVRSKLAHGLEEYHRRGAILDWNAMFTSAKRLNVPWDDMQDAAALAIELIHAYLSDDALMRIIQSNKKPDDITRDLREHFTWMVLGR
jgi:hypothetical protein